MEGGFLYGIFREQRAGLKISRHPADKFCECTGRDPDRSGEIAAPPPRGGFYKDVPFFYHFLPLVWKIDLVYSQDGIFFCVPAGMPVSACAVFA